MNVIETREIRLKRLRMRAMRRGIKEMDLILDAYATRTLPLINDPDLDVFEALLHENDQDLYQWVTGQVDAPDKFRELIKDISQTFNN